MRVALIAPLVAPIREPQRGGSQAFICDLARGLIDRGAEVTLYAASGSDVPGVTVVDVGVDPRVLSSSLYRASGGGAAADSAATEDAFAAVYSAVRESPYDVIHNHAFDAPAISLATALPAPVVHTLHLPPDDAVSAALRRVASDDVPPAVATVSAFQERAWRRAVPVDAILPSYVPTSLIPWSRTAAVGAVFAGRLSPEKGAAEAIDIAQSAGVGIDLYGDSYDADYAERVHSRGDDPGVSLHPAVPRSALWKAMAQATVVLCPAGWDEPFGMVAAEAQACGTPVVAFERGGIGEVVVDGVTGFLVPPGDIGSAADAVGRASRLSRAACRAHATRGLDLERSLDAHEQIYRRVVAAATGAAVRG